MYRDMKAFTLIEVMLGILIFSIVVIGGFQALTFMNIGKIKLVEKTDIIKESYFFSEKLFEEIKKGGVIDFEEYFNRKVVGNTSTQSGHYQTPSGFGNFGYGADTPGTSSVSHYGGGLYFCRSGNGVIMSETVGETGCYNSGALNDANIEGSFQRYGQYAFQFIDYNSNANSDAGNPGDENRDGNIRGDDDDEFLGVGPTVFTGGTNVKEIYLISGDKKHRTLFRWNWKQDHKSPKDSGNNYIYPCDSTTFGTGCLGTIEFLKLEGKDWGINHNSGATSTGSLDGIIDTWIIDKQFTGGTEVIAGSNDTNYRLPLFPDSVNVANFEAYLYPNIDRKYAWKDTSYIDFNPYLKMKVTLLPSWKKRSGMKGEVPKVDLLTTINLSDYFSK